MRLLTTLLLTLLTTVAYAQKDPVTRAWNAPVPPFRIAPNLYYVGAADITSYLITTPKGHIVLDGGFEETAPMIRANIERLGFKVKDVRILIGSHAHYDHAAGLAELKRETGAQFVSSALEAPAYAAGGLNDPQFGNRFPFPPIVADRKVADGERVTLGGISLTAHITAGHTRGCTTWTMGDAVFLCSPSVPESYKLVDNPKDPNVIEDYRRQFVTLKALRPKIFLGSHGGFFDLEEKRKSGNFVDPEGYREFVAAMEKRFEAKVAAESVAAHGLVLHDATVIDGTGAAPRANVDVIVRDGAIVEVVAADAARHPAGAHVIDARGKFVIPGLTDMHAHLLLHPWDEKGEIEPRYDRDAALEHLQLFLRFGVTTVRDPGAETADAVLLRDLVRAGKVPGPEIFTAGRILIGSEFPPEPFVIVRSEDAIREEIRWQAMAGVDAIKVYASMPSNFVEAAIDEAHGLGLPVIGHLQRTTWTAAARLGIDGVEHAAPWSSEYMVESARANAPGGMMARVYWLEHLDEKAIDEMIVALVEHKVVVDPTLMAMHTKFWGDDARYTANPDNALLPEKVRKGWPAGRFTNGWTPDEYARSQKAWPILLRLTKKMHDAGVHLVTGTDTPTPWIVPGASLHDEMQLLADAGIAPMAILRMATYDAARALKREKEFGSIAPGMRADLVVLSKNPLEPIANTRSIEMVVQRGAIIE
ncbi:MAG TPA: subclass B3 metallo-beta-lactamase [Thermoanaerobaculia bacterium]|jgi:imidazolonepropionase-like amidohydrolase|nr:subclass B3 metallo-beta-lactamase [Thermoanaerobaculia bacterium]